MKLLRKEKEKSLSHVVQCLVKSSGSHNFQYIYNNVIQQCYLKIKTSPDEFSKYSI